MDSGQPRSLSSGRPLAGPVGGFRNDAALLCAAYQAFAFCPTSATVCPMKSVRIGAGLGFYGDSWRPVRASIESGGVRDIASDHLAERTLAILQKDRQRDPSAGYTRDVVPMLTELWPLAAERGVKFVMNAGGVNPHGARGGAGRAFREKGYKAKIAVVTGDSISERIDELQAG